MQIQSGVCLLFLLAVTSSSYAAEDDAKPPSWQVEGF